MMHHPSPSGLHGQQPLPPYPQPGTNSNMMQSAHSTPYPLYNEAPNGNQMQDVRFDDNDSIGGTPTQSLSGATMRDSDRNKRAYRQRRKDPSCDQCRERKVKCDATDSKSCTECHGRKTSCRFTKETNRRMSSLKQMQDLEAKVQAKDQQIARLQDALSQKGATDNRDQDIEAFEIHGDVGMSQVERGQGPRMNSFFRVRRNIRNYSRGIFKPPVFYRTALPGAVSTSTGPDLPPKHMTDFLLAQYQHIIHSYVPILHWPTFAAEMENVYRQGSFMGVRDVWITTFFAALLCGTIVSEATKLRELGVDRKVLLASALAHVDIQADESTIDHARCSLLFAIYFNEQNQRSAAALWLSSAVRFAQCCGLHVNVTKGSPMHSEIKVRVWWSILLIDRLFSLDTSIPLVIADKESEACVAEPAPISDAVIPQDGYVDPAAPSNSTDSNKPAALLVLVPVVRIVNPNLRRLLKSKTLAAPTLKTYDDHFDKLQEAFPDPYPVTSNMPLHPFELFVAMVLHIVRFIFNRHNLSPLCHPHERQEALRRCVQIARDTAHILHRSTTSSRVPQAQQPRIIIHPADTSNEEWQSQIRTAMPSFACTHLWRCALVLALCGEYAPALTCVGVMKAVGNNKAINMACGRNLAFFLDRITGILQSDKTVTDIQNDEELLAYASGDLQGDQHSAWAWNGSEVTAPVTAGRESGNFNSTAGTTGDGSGDGPAIGSTLSSQEENDWGGWSAVETKLNTLLRRNGALDGPSSGLGLSTGPMSAPPNPVSTFGFSNDNTYYGNAHRGAPGQPSGPYSSHGTPASAHSLVDHRGSMYPVQQQTYMTPSPGGHGSQNQSHGYQNHGQAHGTGPAIDSPQAQVQGQGQGQGQAPGQNGLHNIPNSGFLGPFPSPIGQQPSALSRPFPQPQTPFDPHGYHRPPHQAPSEASGKSTTPVSMMRIGNIIK